jgi:hypothetical protein
MTPLFCPHCDVIIEIFGEPLAHECECGAVMETYEGDATEVDDAIIISPFDPVDHDRAAEAAAAPISLAGFALMFAGAFLITCIACAVA